MAVPASQPTARVWQQGQVMVSAGGHGGFEAFEKYPLSLDFGVGLKF